MAAATVLVVLAVTPYCIWIVVARVELDQQEWVSRHDLRPKRTKCYR